MIIHGIISDFNYDRDECRQPDGTYHIPDPHPKEDNE